MSITWVDNVTPLNAANMNVLEQTPRKNQNSGYLGLDASGNAALPGNILSGGANLDFRSVGGDVYLTCANGATATMRDLQGNELRLHSDGSLTLNALSNPRLTFDGDTNLYRSAAGTLKTDGTLVATSVNADSGLNSAPGTANQIALSADGNIYFGSDYGMRIYRGPGEMRVNAGWLIYGNAYVDFAAAGNKLYFGGAADTNLYRSAAGMLQTNGGLTIQGGVDPTLVIGYVGNRIWQVRNTGKIEWGPGSTDTVDTNLYRTAAGTLRTDGNLWVQGPDIRILSTSSPGLTLGGDTNLYRAAASVLKTDGELQAASNITFAGTAGAFLSRRRSANGNMLVSRLAADTVDRFAINADGGMNWGPGNAAQDTQLYRDTASGPALKCTVPFRGQSFVSALQGSTNEVALGFTGNSTLGAIAFMSPSGQFDTTWYRGGANILNAYNPVNNNWGTLNAAAFTVQSDRKTKSDGEPVEIDVDKLLSAGVYSYRRDKTKQRHIGLYADELPVEVIGQASTLNGDAHQMVDLYKLTTALLATVQHLNARLTALES